jgi:hypothetical protein
MYNLASTLRAPLVDRFALDRAGVCALLAWPSDC